ncbi:MAG: heparinase II/III family protein [Lentisphaeria bacterium]|jgi:hypothetical protein|nr:heparinase II/III family protein [Lentisphaeria bacterium]
MRFALSVLLALGMGVLAEAPAPLVLLDSAESIGAWRGLKAVPAPERPGETAAQWAGAGTGGVATLEPVPADWSAHHVLCFDLHAEGAKGASFILNAVSDPEPEGRSNYFLHKLVVDWEGWREVRIPLIDFQRTRTPEGWQAVDSLTFHSRGWNIEPTPGAVIHLAHMRLEYNERLARRQPPPVQRREPPELAAWNGPLRFPGIAWEEVFAFAETDETAKRLVADISRRAKSYVAEPVTVRKFSLAEIPEKERDGRYRYAGDNAEVFALAMHDCRCGSMLGGRMVPIALAARLTGEAQYVDWVNRQLAEVATWSPLQRPGWTQYNPNATLPPGGDGNWLATGYSMKAIVQTLQLMGDRVPSDLRTSLRGLLQREIDSIRDDWASRRPWFVRANFPDTNQWVLPNMAMIYASLYLGDERNRAAYELGVRNLAWTCAVQGEDGSWSEGLSYGTMSAEYLFWAAWAMRANGDERLLDFGFARNYNNWLIHMAMPGGFAVNAYDCGRYQLGDTPHDSFLLSALLAGLPEAYWAGENLFRQLPASYAGLLYRYASASREKTLAVPEVFAFFPHQQIVTWRSNWERNHGMGLWIRGGSTRDSHCHRDNGHLSVYNGRTPVLIEAGTPSYDDREMPVKYSPAAGHNMLQPAAAAETDNRGRHTPLTVRRLDPDGGEVVVDGTHALPGVEEWLRAIDWDRGGRVQVVDSVVFGQEIGAGAEVFRFHTGSPVPVEITGTGREWTVRWAGASLALAGDRELVVDQTPWPDRSGVNGHACVRIQVAGATREVKLSSRLEFAVAEPRGAQSPPYDEYRRQFPDGDGRDVHVLRAVDMTGDDARFTVSTTKVGAERSIYNWNYPGQTLAATVPIATAGWYRVFLKCCTGIDQGIPVRSLAVDGKVPFREAARLVFPDTGGWSNDRDDWALRSLGQDEVPDGYCIYLAAGERRLEFVNEEGGGLNVDFIVVHPAGMGKAEALNR